MVDFCTVTGTISDIYGVPQNKLLIEFRSLEETLGRTDSAVLSTKRKSARTDENGFISVNLVPGAYILSLKTNSLNGDEARIVVPDVENAFLHQLIDLPVPDDLDAAQQAVVDARDARDQANIASAAAQAVAVAVDGIDLTIVGYVNTAEAAALAASTSADAASVSEINAAASETQTNLDKIQTGEDAAATAADRVQTGLDAAATEIDRITTDAARAATNTDAINTAADRVQTGLDRTATSEDRIAVAAIFDTFDDRYLGSKEVDPILDNDGDPLGEGAVYWNTVSHEIKFWNGTAWESPEAAASTSAQTAQTARIEAEAAQAAAEADAIQTAADRVVTTQDAIDTAADALQTNADALSTAEDRVQTNAAQIATAADAVATSLDRSATQADRVATEADATATADDRVQTGLDRVAVTSAAITTADDRTATQADAAQTALDRIATGEHVVLTSADKTATETFAINSGVNATLAANDRSLVEQLYGSFEEIYYGAKAADPTTDNAGDPMQVGAMYWNTVDNERRYWNGTIWETPDAALSESVQLSVDAQIASEAARNLSIQAKDNAVIARSGAVTARTGSEAARDLAETYSTEAQTAQTGAELAETNAAQSAQSASLASNAPEWISGETVVTGSLRWSPIDLQTYRAKTDHTGLTTDPSLDGTNWGQANAAGEGSMLKTIFDPQAINSDAFDRANHTGSQGIETITDLQTNLDGKTALVHTHLIGDVTDFTDNSLNWNTAYNWGNHALVGYAPLFSPNMSGIPTAPTALVSTDTAQIATTAFVQMVINTALDGAPAALDTLNELAAAIGDDADFAGTMTQALSTKANISSLGSAALLDTGVGLNDVIIGNDSRLSDSRTPVAHTHTKAELTDFSDEDYATSAQGLLANTAVQPAAISNLSNWDTAYFWGDHALAGYLTSVAWTDVSGKPVFATVATSGSYSDLSNTPSLGTASPLNVPVAGNASVGEVVKGDDTRLSDSRDPNEHTQTLSTITDAGTAAALDVAVSGDAGPTQVVKGDDSRLAGSGITPIAAAIIFGS